MCAQEIVQTHTHTDTPKHVLMSYPAASQKWTDYFHIRLIDTYNIFKVYIYIYSSNHINRASFSSSNYCISPYYAITLNLYSHLALLFENTLDEQPWLTEAECTCMNTNTEISIALYIYRYRYRYKI